MAIRVKPKVNVRIFETTAEEDAYYAPNDANAEQTHDNFQKPFSGRFSIDASTSEVLDFGDITSVRGYLVELFSPSDGTVMATATIDINAVGAVPIGQASAGKSAFTFNEGGPYSSIEIANTHVSTVLEGRYAVWGDPV